MKIPRKFKLFEQTIKVVKSDILESDRGNWGLMSPHKNMITIQVKNKVNLMKKSMVEQTFYHELVHCILSQMQEKELGKNEKFVDVFASLLHQYEKTKKF